MRRFRDESGQVLVLVALSMTVLLGFVGFATDVGVMLRERRMVQSAADAAALAGAAESLSEGTPSSVTSGMWTAAYNDAALNGFTPGASNGTTNSSTGVTLKLAINPNIDISGYNSDGYVQAVVTQNTPTTIMSMFGFSSVNVVATAIASNTLESNGCIYVQDGGNNDPSDTVDLNGHSLIASPSCGMTVNGSISSTGSSNIDAKFVEASGTITGGSSSWQSGVPAPPDPLHSLQQTANQPTVPSGTANGGACTPPAGSGMSCIYNFNNGVLSGTLQSNTIYYFDSNVNGGGGPTVSGDVILNPEVPTGAANGVTIYLAGNIPLDFSNNGKLELYPPGYDPTATPGSNPCVGSTNPLCGVLIDAPTDTGRYVCKSGKGNNQGNNGELYFDFGSSTTTLNGIVYAPNAQMFVQDQGASTTINTDLVIGNMCLQSADVTVNGFSGGSSPITRVGLVY
jgi:Flp pilus assembly protein TadG